MSEISVSRRSQQDLIYVTTGITQPRLNKCTIRSNTVFLSSNYKEKLHAICIKIFSGLINLPS